jgi:hypothetical protein
MKFSLSFEVKSDRHIRYNQKQIREQILMWLFLFDCYIIGR